MKKKLISLLLAATMVLSPVSAFAAEVPKNTGRTARTPDIFRDTG